MDAVTREEGAILQRDRVWSLSLSFPRSNFGRADSIASATASASLLIATLCTRKTAAPASRKSALGRSRRNIAFSNVASGDRAEKRFREVPATIGKPKSAAPRNRAISCRFSSVPWQNRTPDRARSASRTPAAAAISSERTRNDTDRRLRHQVSRVPARYA